MGLLVLSRHRDETIMIGDRIAVTVVDIRGGKVRLGIDAPRDLPVHRKEVYDAIRREVLTAAAAPVIPATLVTSIASSTLHPQTSRRTLEPHQ